MQKPFALIVEDERDIAALFRQVLDLAGYRTEIAARGKRALERLTTGEPDIVLLDLTLPEIPGAEILEIMRADERLKKIPVVVITGYPEIAESLSVEPDLVMIKPVSSEQLTKLVDRLGRTPRSRAAIPFSDTPWDRVTGLYNRPFFVNRLEEALQSVKDNGQTLFAVLLVGPSRAAGTTPPSTVTQTEASLREVAQILKSSVRPTDTIARFEEDHFFILIEGIPNSDIPQMVATRLQEKLGVPPAHESGGPFTASIGVLLCDAQYKNVSQIQRDIKTAYASVFKPGAARYMVFERQTPKKAAEGKTKAAR